MKYKGSLISDLSGRVGGLVASHNTYGTYLRRHVKPVNPRTPAQQEQRAAIAAVAQSWRQLDPTVQVSWAAAGIVKTSRKGDRITLTGSNAFSYINVLRFRAGLALITDPPTDPSAALLTLPAVVFTSANHVNVDFTSNSDTWSASGGVVNFSAALITSPGVSYKRASRGVAQVLGPQTGVLDLALPFAVPIGGTLRLELHASDPTGRQSTYRTIDATNPSFPPPSALPLRVLSVSQVGVKTFLWTFNGPVTVAGIADAHLIVDGDTSGNSGPAGLDTALVGYTTANSPTGAWSIDAQPTSITESVASPQSGTLV